MLEIFERIFITKFQIPLLLQRYERHREAHTSACIVSEMAFGLAQALQLNVEVSADRGLGQRNIPNTVMETREQLLWSCAIMYFIMNAGSRSRSGLTMSSMDVKFPWDERSYEVGISPIQRILRLRTACPSSRPSHQGTSAYVVKLGVLRIQILKCTQSYRTNQAPSSLSLSMGF